jgi:signal peptide peptidase SppA
MADHTVEAEQEQAPPPQRYGHVVKALSEHPWAILPQTLDKIVEIVRLRASGGRLSDEEIRLRIAGATTAPTARATGQVQVIPVFGVISHRMNMFTAMSGGTSTELLGAQLQDALSNAKTSAILLDIDSPGGSVQGIQELADAIYAARGKKQLIASVNATCASAAYWLATQCDQIVVTPSGQVGSIGVIAIHEDLTKQAAMLGVKVTYVTAGKFKGEGQPFVALTDEARAAIQELVDGYYAAFVEAVARGRSVTTDAVLSGFGEGRVVSAVEALKLDMVDRIETMEQALARLSGQTPRLAVAASRPDTAQLAASAVQDALQAGAFDSALRSTLATPNGGAQKSLNDLGGKPAMSTELQAAANMVDPNPDGSCPDGYSKGSDGMCHMKAKAEDEHGAPSATHDVQVRDGEIVVKLSELNELKKQASLSNASRIKSLEATLEEERVRAAEFMDKQRENRIAMKVRDVRIPMFRGYVKAFYDMALRHVAEGQMYQLLDPKVNMTAEALVDSFVSVVNKQAEVLFRTASVDTKPTNLDEPDEIQKKIEYRVQEHIRVNKLDATKDYKKAMRAVLDADPELKEAYTRS